VKFAKGALLCVVSAFCISFFTSHNALASPIDVTTTTSASAGGVIDEQGGVPLPATSVSPSTVASAVTTIPAGCMPPDASQAVFVGALVVKDSTTATFGNIRLRSGSLEGYQVSANGTDTVVMYYGRDVKFLEVGKEYLVGAGLDVGTGRIFSRVTEATELFGGNQVADIDKTGAACPRFADPARTLHVDGSSIESGVLSTLAGSGSRLALSVVLPAGLVLLALVTLVLVRRLIGAARSAR
jgi:hypothetical protein